MKNRVRKSLEIVRPVSYVAFVSHEFKCSCRQCSNTWSYAQGGSYVLTIGGGGAKMPTVGSTSLGTKLGEAGIVILIHCATMLLKILNVYCLK